MGKFFIRFFLLTLFQGQILFASAQVNVQDSLSLVALYNNTSGSTWTNHTNWLVTSVNQWYGVELLSNRVSVLNLANNNLTGTLPNEICDFTALKYWYFDNNQISGVIPSCIGNATSINSFSFRNNQLIGAVPVGFNLMPQLADVWVSNNQLDDFPDLTMLPEVSNLAIDGNQFTFEDIETNVAIANSSYLYSPQAPVGTTENIVVDIYYNFSFTVSVGGANNAYQWYKDGEALQNNARFNGVTSSTLVNTSALLIDAGVYTCQVKNTVAIFLTLASRNKTVAINDTRLNDTIMVQNNDTLYCSITSSTLLSTTLSGLPVYFEIISGNELVSLIGNTALEPLGVGVIELRAYTDGDLNYKPFSKVISMKILPSLVVPPFFITHDLPVEKEDTLYLSVPSVAGLTYVWNTPQGIINDVFSITVKNIQKTDEGLYSVKLYENACRLGWDSVEVRLTEIATTLIIYELITPNGDGKNDVFYIENIENSPNTEVTIFNAWNQIVFHSTQYRNDWDGGGLPVGNYYYLVQEIDCRCDAHKGIVYIKQ